MRDPLDPKPKAFEVLGVGFNADGKEIDAAYARKVRETTQAQKRAEIILAWQRIRRLETRLEDDIWCYRVADVPPAASQGTTDVAGIRLEAQLPALRVDPTLTNISGDAWRRDLRPFEFRECSFTPLVEYARPEAPHLRLNFES